MKLFKILTLASILFLCACSGNDIVDKLSEDLNEDINPEKVIQISYTNHELAIYPTEENNIQIYIYRDQKLVHSGRIEQDELAEETLLWSYSEEEENDSSFLVGGIEKNYNPLISVNGNPFDGSIISLDSGYVFFSFYDATLTNPIDVVLEGGEK